VNVRDSEDTATVMSPLWLYDIAADVGWVSLAAVCDRLNPHLARKGGTACITRRRASKRSQRRLPKLQRSARAAAERGAAELSDEAGITIRGSTIRRTHRNGTR